RITEASVVPHFEDLVGIQGVQPGLSLQLVPYGTSTLRSTFQTSNLAPRDSLEWQVGLDAKYGLTGTLTLDLTINPRFAQGEGDPEVVNLSAYEVQFPEKRPFFLEGNDLFLPVNFMFYPRRIGAPPAAPDPQHGGDIVQLDAHARILGAAKLSGNLRPGTAIGLLGAYVDETTAIERVGAGELSPSYALQASPPTFFEATRVRQSIGGSSGLGVTETSVVRGGGQPNAHVLNLDLDLRGASDYSMFLGTGWTDTKACDAARTPSFHVGDYCDALGAAVYGGKTGGA